MTFSNNPSILIPELILLCWGFMLLLLDLFAPRTVPNNNSTDRSKTFGKLAALGLLLAFVATFNQDWMVGEAFSGLIKKTSMSLSFCRLFIFAGFLTALLSTEMFAKRQINKGTGPDVEYYALLLFSIFGMCALVAAEELILFYIALELATIPLYILASYSLADPKSAEGGLKFIIMGALSSGLLLFGFSLLYGAVGGSTLFSELSILGTHWDGLTLTALGLVLAGIGFKITLAPFHLWAPDAYQGAPTPVTAFLSVGSKAAGIGALFKILSLLAPVHGLYTQPIFFYPLAIISAITMTWGNLVAIKQTSMKRFLAYSSISQAGYMLMGLVAFDTLGLSSLMFYLFLYILTNIAAFAVVVTFESTAESDQIKDYSGLSRRSPILALIMLLALFSLAGIPPLSGFFGKFYLFAAVFSKGLYWLVILAALNSTLSLYYYLQIVRRMYIEEPRGLLEKIHISYPLKICLALTAAGTVLVGIIPTFFDIAQLVVWM